MSRALVQFWASDSAALNATTPSAFAHLRSAHASASQSQGRALLAKKTATSTVPLKLGSPVDANATTAGPKVGVNVGTHCPSIGADKEGDASGGLFGGSSFIKGFSKREVTELATAMVIRSAHLQIQQVHAKSQSRTQQKHVGKLEQEKKQNCLRGLELAAQSKYRRAFIALAQRYLFLDALITRLEVVRRADRDFVARGMRYVCQVINAVPMEGVTPPTESEIDEDITANLANLSTAYAKNTDQSGAETLAQSDLAYMSSGASASSATDSSKLVSDGEQENTETCRVNRRDRMTADRVPDTFSNLERLCYCLQRAGGLETSLSFTQIVSLFLSVDVVAEIQRINPFATLESVQHVVLVTQLVMLKTNRIGQVHRCIAEIKRIFTLFHALCPSMFVEMLRAVHTNTLPAEAFSVTTTNVSSSSPAADTAATPSDSRKTTAAETCGAAKTDGELAGSKVTETEAEAGLRTPLTVSPVTTNSTGTLSSNAVVASPPQVFPFAPSPPLSTPRSRHAFMFPPNESTNSANASAPVLGALSVEDAMLTGLPPRPPQASVPRSRITTGAPLASRQQNQQQQPQQQQQQP